jgi:hypothetical protein
MATWAKIKFYYDSIPEKSGVTVAATSTESMGSYDASYLAVPLEGSFWQAEDSGMASTQDITWDSGVGSSYDADYFGVIGHNFNTAGVSIVLQYSTDNFATDVNDAFTAYAPTDDLVQLKEFSSPGAKRYWRLRITSATGDAPYASIVKFGLESELDYATASFDPHAQERKANVNLSYGGFITGIHEQYTERHMSLKFSDGDSSLYTLVNTWWEDNGLNNFFVAWDLANNPTEVFLMRGEAGFENPLTNTGAYRDITINLRGRKE